MVIGGCLPTREQGWLLRSALWRDAEALDAWEKWQAYVDIDALDPGSTRLLPLLYLNLRRLGVEHPWMQKFKEVYRTAWTENQRHLQYAAPAVRALQAAGIQTMALKGAALIVNYYKDFGARPIGDLDVLVPTRQRAAAAEILESLGWAPREWVPIYNSRAYTHPTGGELDLHWHLLAECLDDNADTDFWNGAGSARVGEVPISVPNAADLILHLCTHGLRWNATPPNRWVADVVTILDSAPKGIDWDRLVAQARARALVLVLRTALAYLCDEMRAPIPSPIMNELNAATLSGLECRDYAARTIPPQSLGLELYWVGYLRLARTTNLGRLGLLEYLRRVWDLKHRWQVPLFALRRAWREARMRMRHVR